MSRLGGVLFLLAVIGLPGPGVAQNVSASRSPDRVVLRDGTVLRGRIVAADQNTVALVFAFGGRVEFQRKDLRSLHRAERAPSREPGTAPGSKSVPIPEPLPRLEQRFLVYHGETPVGFRTVVQTRAHRLGRDGVLRKDEVVFHEPVRAPDARQPEIAGLRRPDDKDDAVEPGEPCRVVCLEFVADHEDFRTCYYREAGRGTDTVVDATFQGDELKYTWVRASRRTFHRVHLERDVKLPLGFWWRVARNPEPDAQDPEPAKIWNPRERKVTEISVRRRPGREVVVGSRRLRVVPVQIRQEGQDRLRWLTTDGFTLKETLNGVALVAVATSRPGFPPPARPGRTLRLRAERALAGTCLDPDSGLVVAVPARGWIRSPVPRPGSVMTLVNPELRASLAVYAGAAGDPWPGPEPGPGCRVRPVRFGGWPGEGWTAATSPGRPETVVRRTRTSRLRVAVVLETPRELASAVLMDLARLLREMQVPGITDNVGREGDTGGSGTGRVLDRSAGVAADGG